MQEVIFCEQRRIATKIGFISITHPTEGRCSSYRKVNLSGSAGMDQL
jgi:hypothetical protein